MAIHGVDEMRALAGSHVDALARLRGVILLAAVLIAGAAVMILEFTAIRFLQRYYGGALDVWAAEIAVCLAGLALGYGLGGILADRFRSFAVLGAAIIFSGLTGLLIAPIAEWTCEHMLEWDAAIQWQPLLAAGASSLLPLLALGTVMPQAVRLRVQSVEQVGKVAGGLAALSTAGSIAGVLLTGMYLLTRFGVTETVNATSIVLIITGGALMLTPLTARRAAALMLLAFLAPAAHAEIIFERYSAYHHILVEDKGDTRTLWFDRDSETMMSLSDPYAGGWEYTDFFHVPMVLNPTLQRVLFVGLGGGTGPKSFLKNYPAMQVDVAEIDPMVLEVAQKYFHLPSDSRLSVRIMDGRVFIRRSKDTYGAIILDAYSSGPSGGYLPYHLATREFFDLVRERLTPGGCVVYNVITDYGEGTVLRDIYTTMVAVFGNVYVFRTNDTGNTILVAMNAPSSSAPGLKPWPAGPWRDHPISAPQLRQMAFQLRQAEIPLPGNVPQRIGQLITYAPGPAAQILSDEFAPVDMAR